jgi:hypothetical protein
MRRLAVLAALVASCGDARPAAPAPPVLALDAPFHERAGEIVFDGVARDVAWTAASDVLAPLSGPGPREVRIRAVHDGRRIYLLARWKDEEPTMNRYWKLRADGVWERHRGEDGFALAWSPGALRDAFRRDGCALFCHDGRHARPGADGMADVWFWGLQRSYGTRQAIDMAIRFGEGGRLRGDSQPEDSGNQENRSTEVEGPACVPFRVNELSRRVLTIDNAQPLPKNAVRAKIHASSAGWEVPYDVVRAGKGSRGDVAAAALFEKGEWTLELSRLFVTGNEDDQPLGDPLVPALFAVALFDGTEGSEHAISPPVELRILPAR